MLGSPYHNGGFIAEATRTKEPAREGVQRYSVDPDRILGLKPSADGGYVAYSDYIADLSPQPKVKPLVWEKNSFRMWDCYSLVGVYRMINAHSGGYSVTRSNKDTLKTPEGLTNFATVDAAKAAAKADHDRRILSALE